MNIINKINVLNKISEEMKLVVKHQQDNASSEPATDNNQMRLNYELEREFWNEGGAVMFGMHDVFIDFEQAKIKTRIYYPQEQDQYKTIFFIHGGGWVVGSIKTHDRMMRNLASLSKCAVIGIDYSLAPDKKFPFQIQECNSAIEYFIKNSKKYKLYPDEFSYAGDSAGANMCMGTFLYQKDKKIIDTSLIKSMALFYGVYGLKDSVSRTLYGNDIDWLREEDMQYYYNEYLKKDTDINSKFVNIFNADLTDNIPNCFIASCEFDPLKDDSVALYEILKQTNDSEYKEYKGVMHAFLHYTRMMKIANEAIQDGANFITKNFNFNQRS
ncbi:acetyl esterase [Campylobacter pinnipediorum]|uniref:acetyl esterase n=1 Tax=Campylobacter pinnipediorum TaxID=1965231 RepID=UPI00084D212A|nr:acetyl esterase [Campylobacter pinnipediorum]